MAFIREVIWAQKFERDFKKIKDDLTKSKIKKQIQKILQNPKVGKPLRHELKGEWAVYVKPYRLVYAVVSDKLFLLRFEHRDKVYKR